jgi:hypothetical protein
VRANVVQEGGTGMWNGGYGPGGITSWADQNSGDVTTAGVANFNFTRLSMFHGDNCHCHDDWGYLTIRANNSEIWGAGIGSYVLSAYMTNCLFDRATIGNNEGHAGNQLHFRNCTWHGGELSLVPSQTALPVSVTNCAFDATKLALNQAKLVNPGFDYNAFTNGATHFPVGGAHDVPVPSFDWQSSSFGNYYLPTNSPLIDAGDVTADSAGFAYLTTQTSQVEEGTSRLDLGYHYAAIWDIDSDGLADSWELNYFGNLEHSGTDLDGQGNTLLWDYRVGRNPNISPTADINGLVGLQIYTPLK